MLVAPIPASLDEESIRGARLFSNRTASLSAWPRKAKVAELGVAVGSFTKQVLDHADPVLYDAYDTFRLHQIPVIWNRQSSELLNNMEHQEFYEDKFSNQIAAGILRTFKGDSSTELAKRDPETYDVIYIDGDHSYDGVKKDLVASLKTLKFDGMLVFNDYVLYDKTGNMYGVMPVVHDICLNHGWRVYYLSLQREMFCDIALVRR